MSSALGLSVAAIASYLIGSIPFGLLIARGWHGVDVRHHGSGNIGATNVGRVVGKKWGVACLVLDFLKGLVPSLLFPKLLLLPEDEIGTAATLCGAAAILGHVFPAWLGFRGGKGVATGAGVAAVLAWPAALVAVAAFALVFAWRRFVSLASIVAATVYAAVALALLDDPFAKANWPVAAFTIAIPSLIVLRHVGNIRRLLRGEEQRYTPGAQPDRVSLQDRKETDRARLNSPG